jgi:Uma2 family endonuclease
MAIAPSVPLEEYLATHYQPDREYVDGVVEERNLGEYDHARLQTKIDGWFDRHEREWGIRVVVEQRMRARATRFRIPDVAVFLHDQAIEQVFTHPPLIAIEVLSPCDTLRSIEAKVNDYLDFGVGHIWIVDPEGPKSWIATRGQLTEGGPRLEVPGTPVYLALSELEL